MKILCIGDVTSAGGIRLISERLWKFRTERGIDLCIVNAENAAFITGASPENAEALFSAGADVLTGGNHTLRNKASWGYLDTHERMLRPINFGDAAGSGYCILDCLGYRVMVISAMGNVHIEPTLDSPFGYIDRLLAREEGRYDLAILDIHAEATGEKLAVAHCYDGRINIVFGTHTHVPTSDLKILPRGTGYVTDLGMCGECGGILGMDAECVVARMRSHLPLKFEASKGAPEADGVIFDLNPTSGRVTRIERVKIK